jgi:hypothetical protein
MAPEKQMPCRSLNWQVSGAGTGVGDTGISFGPSSTGVVTGARVSELETGVDSLPQPYRNTVSSSQRNGPPDGRNKKPAEAGEVPWM